MGKFKDWADRNLQGDRVIWAVVFLTAGLVCILNGYKFYKPVTVVLAESATAQVPVPEQPPPLQPRNIEPVGAAAVRVTDVPSGNSC